MRVLLVTGSFPPMKCGVGDYSARLAQALGERRDVEVGVLTSAAATERPTDEAFVLLPGLSGWRVRDTRAALEAIRSWKPEILHIQYPTQGYGRGVLPVLLPGLASALGAAVVQTWHEHQQPRRPTEALAFALHGAIPGGLVVVRPGYREAIRSPYRLALHNKRFRFIANASPARPALVSDERRAQLRAALAPGPGRLIGFFGFLYPHKRVELLFEIANPTTDRLVIMGSLDRADPYHRRLLERADAPEWRDRASFTGYVPLEELSEKLACMDAVVLPFENGGGEWNTSLHTATMQGTFVVTTSTTRQGYDAAAHVYYAHPGDLDGMRAALAAQAGHSHVRDRTPADPWTQIAEAHVELYADVLRHRCRHASTGEASR